MRSLLGAPFRAGPLSHRDFRLLLAARTVSLLGNAIAPVAVAFAVLELGGPTDLGIVLAARQLPPILFLLVGGVWADRLPRNVVMVGSNLVSGGTQLAVAALLLSGRAEIWQLAALEALNGIAFSFFFPASQGVVPQTVSPPHLQQANVLLRMGLNATSIGGAALGGVLVAAIGSGWAVGIDGVTFLLAGVLLFAMRLPRVERPERTTVLHDLRVGWNAFRSRTWLWAIVVAFGFLNAAHAGGQNVLAPVVANEELGGPGAFGLMAAAFGAGLVAGGLLLLRWKPARILLVGCAAAGVEIVFLASLAVGAPLLAVLGGAFVTGIGFEVFGVFWETALQQNVPHDMLSRVYSYDALGSFVLLPLGLVAAGPLAAAVGVDAALWIACGVIAACVAGMLLVRDVRVMRRGEAATPSP